MHAGFKVGDLVVTSRQAGYPGEQGVVVPDPDPGHSDYTRVRFAPGSKMAEGSSRRDDTLLLTKREFYRPGLEPGMRVRSRVTGRLGTILGDGSVQIDGATVPLIPGLHWVPISAVDFPGPGAPEAPKVNVLRLVLLHGGAFYTRGTFPEEAPRQKAVKGWRTPSGARQGGDPDALVMMSAVAYIEQVR